MDCSRVKDTDKFWSLIERKMGCIVPKYLRNILRLRGFDDPVSVSTMEKEDIDDLKTFVKTSMKVLIPANADPLDYYYLTIYVNKPEDSEIAPGHLKLLRSIIDFIKAQTASHGHAFFDFYNDEPAKRVNQCKDLSNEKTRKLKNKNFLLIKNRRGEETGSTTVAANKNVTGVATGSNVLVSESKRNQLESVAGLAAGAITKASSTIDRPTNHSIEFARNISSIPVENCLQSLQQPIIQEPCTLYFAVSTGNEGTVAQASASEDFSEIYPENGCESPTTISDKPIDGVIPSSSHCDGFEEVDRLEIPNELFQEKQKLFNKVHRWLEKNAGDTFKEIRQKIDQTMVFIYSDKDIIDDDGVTFKLAVGIRCPYCDNPIKVSETTITDNNGDDKLYLSLSNFTRHYILIHLARGKKPRNEGCRSGSKVLKKSKVSAGHRVTRKSKQATYSDESNDESLDESLEDFAVTKVYSDGSSEEEIECRPRKGLKIQRSDVKSIREIKEKFSTASVGTAKAKGMIKKFDPSGEPLSSSVPDHACADLKSLDHPENLLLKKFMNSAEKNVDRAKPGYRHDFTIKMFASYIKMIGGPLSYETWHANMPFCLPSSSIVNKFVADYGPPIVEGEMRTKELVQYLELRNLPMRINISEDATRITPSINYDPKTNQLVGFVLPLDKNGMPKLRSYLARSVKEMQNHFENAPVSSSVVVQMAQPQVVDSKEDAPAFCLNLFLTDNKFTTETILKRWRFTIHKLRESNIIVDNFASDADPKYMKAMRIFSQLGEQNMDYLESEYFSCGGHAVTTCTQDPLHVLTKERNRVLKVSRLTQIGSKIISQSHLKYLIDNVSKDKHGLTMTDINPKDRQNTFSAEKMCSIRTIQCLLQFVPGCEGTVAYLKAMNNFISSYLDATLDSNQRIYRIWCSLFFFRGWRSWLVNCTKSKMKRPDKKSSKTTSRKASSGNFTLSENFISTICYHAIELNAHTMVKQLLNSRVDSRGDSIDESKRDGGYVFVPHLEGSQQCEGRFRQVRSFSPTYSTVVNCSMLDIINRLRKIQLQSDIINCCSDEIHFPRFEKNVQCNKIKHVSLVSKAECITIINKAMVDIKSELIELGMREEDLDFHCQVDEVRTIDEEITEVLLDVYTDDEFETENEAEARVENSVDYDWENEEEHENLDENNRLLNGITGELSLKDYSGDSGARFDIENTDRFVVVEDNSGNAKVVRKSTVCWYLQKNKYKLSSDRLQRVQESDIETSYQTNNRTKATLNQASISQCNEIHICEWCVFLQNEQENLEENASENETYLIGHVLSFTYIGGKTFREREFTKPYATVRSPTQPQRNIEVLELSYRNPSTVSKSTKVVTMTKSVGVLCSWYRWDSNGILKSVDDKIHQFVPISNYRGTIMKPQFTNSVLHISTSAVDALNELIDNELVESSLRKLHTSQTISSLTPIKAGDYVICTVQTEYNRTMRFVGQVISIEDDGQEYEINFMQRSKFIKKSFKQYVFTEPAIADIAFVCVKNILHVLKNPFVSRRNEIFFDDEQIALNF